MCFLGGETYPSLPPQAKKSIQTSSQWCLTIAGRLLSALPPLSGGQLEQTFPRVIAELHSAVCLVADVLNSRLHKQPTSFPFL